MNELIITIAVVILVIVAAFIAYSVSMKKRLDEMNRYKNEAISDCYRLMDEREKLDKTLLPFFATYRFSDTDLQKGKRAMESEAISRMGANIGRRIIQKLGATEIVENGLLVGYSVEVDVRKRDPGITHYRFRPELVRKGRAEEEGAASLRHDG